MASPAAVEALVRAVSHLSDEDLRKLTDRVTSDLTGVLEPGWYGPGYSDGTPIKVLFGVRLTGVGEGKKVGVVRVLRQVMGLPLNPTLGLLEGLPRVVRADISLLEAEDLVRQLRDAGGLAEIV